MQNPGGQFWKPPQGKGGGETGWREGGLGQGSCARIASGINEGCCYPNPLFSSLPAPFFWQAGAAPRRPIAEWEVYRGIKGKNFIFPSKASQSPLHAGYSILVIGMVTSVRIGLGLSFLLKNWPLEHYSSLQNSKCFSKVEKILPDHRSKEGLH